MKKLIRLIVSTMLVMSLLTGCYGQRMEMAVNSDGTCTYQVTYLYSKELYEQAKASPDSSVGPLESGDFVRGETLIEGKDYYTFQRAFTFDSVQTMGQFLINSDTYYNTMVRDSNAPDQYKKEDLEAPFTSLLLSNMRFNGTLREGIIGDASSSGATVSNTSDASVNTSTDGLGIIFEMSITLPEAITESNGTINGNTATWTMDNMPVDQKLYAGTASRPIASVDSVAPVVSGVANGKCYRGERNIEVTDNTSIREVTLNGKNYGTTKFKLSKDGKHTLVATDANNNTTTLRFTIDNVKPVVKGAKNGKVYRNKKITLRFSDKLSGIKSVKINKKNRNKKKVTLKKKGTYNVKVTDKAGNVTTMKFQIKKKKK